MREHCGYSRKITVRYDTTVNVLKHKAMQSDEIIQEIFRVLERVHVPG